MNIFVLDEDVAQSVRYSVDSHTNKIVLECSQMISWNMRYVFGVDMGYKFKSGDRWPHRNHPWTIWIRESLANFMWAKTYAHILAIEAADRWGRSQLNKAWQTIQDASAPNLLNIGLTPFPQCVGIKIKEMKLDTVSAYRLYYNQEKRHLFKWTNRPVPPFIQNEQNKGLDLG